MPTTSNARTPRNSRLRLSVLLVLLVAGALLFGARDALAQTRGERITSYNIDATIEANNSVLFKETIAYDFGSAQRHGIFRDIVTRQRFDDRNDRVYELDVLSVTSPTRAPAGYEVESSQGESHIKIGDPDRTITGQHTYVISYRLRGILNAFEDHDELYWNMVAPLWAVPIENTSIVVRAPQAPTRIACFAGPVRSTLPCAKSSTVENDATFSTPLLRPNEAFSVVVALPKGAVPEPTPILEERWAFSRAFMVDPWRVGAMLVVLAGAVFAIVRLAWTTGRDRQARGQVVASIPAPEGAIEERVPFMNGAVTPTEYIPPESMRPGLIGTLFDEVAHPLDVSATIVDLAVRGYLKIEEIEATGWFGSNDWQLTRLKPSDGLATYETLLLDGLFEDGDTVKFGDLKTTFATKFANVQNALYQELVDRGWYHRSPSATRSMWIGIAIGLLVASIGLVAVAAMFTAFGIVPLPLVLGAIAFLVVSGRMPARTGKGTAAYRRSVGFRRFIVEAETERARFAERAGLFYEYLPYAIVFGATKQWAKAFEGLNLPAPDWYVASHPFTTLALMNAMGSFSDNSVSALTSTPGGSGSSGFGGGGFSGGGGGGGGGGSW